MQLYRAIVRLGEDAKQEVCKTGIAAAEVVLLKHVHGSSAVRDVMKLSTQTTIGIDVLRERLIKIYGVNVVESAFGQGLSMQIPLSLDSHLAAKADRPEAGDEIAALKAQLAELQAIVARKAEDEAEAEAAAELEQKEELEEDEVEPEVAAAVEPEVEVAKKPAFGRHAKKAA